MADRSPLTEISDEQRQAFARLLMGDQPPAVAAPDQPVVPPTYMSDLLSGQRTSTQPFGYGALRGNFTEVNPAAPPAPWETLPPSPVARAVGLGIEGGPFQAALGASLPTSPGALVSPGARVGVGPVGVSANLSRRQGVDDAGMPTTVTTPTYGVDATIPVGGGDASANFTVTPGQRKSLQAEYRRKLWGGEVGATVGADMPNEGKTDWRAGIFGGWRF